MNESTANWILLLPMAGLKKALFKSHINYVQLARKYQIILLSTLFRIRDINRKKYRDLSLKSSCMNPWRQRAPNFHSSFLSLAKLWKYKIDGRKERGRSCCWEAVFVSLPLKQAAYEVFWVENWIYIAKRRWGLEKTIG